LEVKAVAEYIKVAGKLNTVTEVANIAKVTRKLDLQNLEVLNS
jgi:hypothetical protein